jgi:DNA polymerase-3 subunit gamma/tau
VPDTDSRASEFQSLYRRFRPQRFDEVLGQEHVSMALRNAVRHDKVAHAYLFSGPRGTGKTSTARILAKALNCAAPEDGEPCGLCDSCVEIARGTSLDVHELDAASNNGVDAMRDLVARAALGTPGRWKVYIVDEVHMLSTAASNALLKTLEEPPGHVVFVLATTDSQKVLPTVRSRTQHFEFRLLGPATLEALVRRVRSAAGLELGEDAVVAAVRKGRGSARDALSALDQLAAAGIVEDEVPVLAELADALADRDAGRALVALAQAVAAGRDVHTLSVALVEQLRQGFLSMVAPDLVQLPEDDRPRVEDVAKRLGLPALVRAMETLGKAEIDMRDAPDARVTLEAALIRLAHPQADDSGAALLERIDRLERALAGAGAAPAAPPAPAGPSVGGSGDPASAGPAETPAQGVPGPDMARQSLAALRRQARQRPAPKTGDVAGGPQGSEPSPPSGVSRRTEGSATHTASATTTATMPTRDELVQAWGDGLLASLSNRARARFRVGRFLAVDDGAAVFALPNDTHRSYCEEVRLEVEQMLGGRFGTAVPLRLVVDDEATSVTTPSPGRTDRASTSATATSAAPSEDHSALLDPVVLAAETEPAGAGLTPEQRLKQVFPGAEEV